MLDPSSIPAAAVFKVDRFTVPGDALVPFIERLQRINQALGALPGCHQNLVLTGASDTSASSDTAEVSVVTIVAWASVQSMAAAKALMQQRYAEEGFDPAAFMRTLGVRADMGLYTNSVRAAEESIGGPPG